MEHANILFCTQETEWMLGKVNTMILGERNVMWWAQQCLKFVATYPRNSSTSYMNFLTDKAEISAHLRFCLWVFFIRHFYETPLPNSNAHPQGHASYTCKDCLQLTFTMSRTDNWQTWYSSNLKTIHPYLAEAWTVTFTFHPFKQSPIPRNAGDL